MSAALAAAPASAHPPKHVGSCNAHRAHATAATGKVIVYNRRAGLDGSGGALTIDYACLRPAGKPVEVGRSATSDGEYPGNESIADIRIAGTFVADSSATGFASEAACSKYGEPASTCAKAVTWWVEVVNARTRQRLHAPAGDGATAVTVAAAGAVAWVQATGSSASLLQAMVLHPGGRGRLTGTEQTLDTGVIGRSPRFTGLTLRWTNSGQVKSQTLS